MDIYTIVFVIGVMLGIAWSLWELYKKHGVPWDEFNPKYIFRTWPFFLVFFVIFQEWLVTQVIPQHFLKALAAGLIAGMGADLLILHLWDTLMVLFGRAGPKSR
ncbi:MAG: hypothetical protein PVF58_14335 [Candidatus Methanofastidiosia archaeon]|jgi:hypothetical protein